MRFCLLIFGCLLFSACNGVTQSTRISVVPSDVALVQPASEVAKNRPATSFSSELLHHLLLAHIAVQSNHDAVALESMSRAAYLSRHREIVAWAMQLAEQQEAHQQVIALSHLMSDIAPHNFDNQLTRAAAQFYSGQRDQAWQTLLELAREQRLDAAAPLQQIASLLAKQSPPLLTRFRVALQDWQNNPQLTFTAALLAYELKQYVDFRTLLEQALQLRPDWETAAMLKLTHLAGLMEATEAEGDSYPEFNAQTMSAFANDFLHQFPHAKRFQIHYAMLLLQHEQIQKSLAYSETVLQQDPHSSAALFASAMAYLQQENLPKARARLQRFLELNPHHDQTRLYLADIEIKQANLAAASALLHQVASQNHYLDAQIKLAEVFAKQHGIKAGIAHLAKIDILNEAEAIHIVLAQEHLYRDFNLPNRAKSVLDAGLKRNPTQPNLLYRRGLLAAQLNLLELHERDMRTLIALQSQHAHAYNALGYTLADQTERLDEALELITTAFAMQPHDPFILDSMGWVNFRLGNHAKAIEYLRRALAVKQDAEIAAHLGEVLWRSGHKREARKIWQQGKQWSPHNATLLETLKRFTDATSSRAPPAKLFLVMQTNHPQASSATSMFTYRLLALL